MKERETKLPLFVRQFEVTPKKKRQEVFEKELVWILNIDFGIEFEGFKDSYTRWFTDTVKFGRIEYFPKGDKVHIHNQGTSGYREQGLRWVVDNLASI